MSEFGSGEQDVSVLRSQQHYRVSQGNIPYIPIAITLKLKRFYHVAWVRQESGFNAIYLNSVEIGVAGLPTGALDIDDGGLWLGQTQSAVGRFSPGTNCLCKLDETALHDDDLGQTEINRRYWMTRRLKELECEGLQTNMVSTKLDYMGAPVNARLDALEVQLAANQNALLDRFQNIDDFLDDLSDVIFDIHMVDDMDMEITACLNLGGTAGLMIAPAAAVDSEIVGIVGVDAYGNGAMVSPATQAQLGFGFEAGAEMGIEATACLGGITVMQTEVEGAAADLRDAVNSLAQNLGLRAAINELESINISTDPTDLLNSPPDIINALPLPGNVKKVFNAIGDIVPTSLSDLDPCGASGPFASITSVTCGQANDPLDTLNLIKTVVSTIEGAFIANANLARDAVNANVAGVQRTVSSILTRVNEHPT